VFRQLAGSRMGRVGAPVGLAFPLAGGLKAADHIYNAAPKDGGEFGIVASQKKS
jgi:hypothetical protein